MVDHQDVEQLQALQHVDAAQFEVPDAVVDTGRCVGHVIGDADHQRLRERHLEARPIAPPDEQAEFGGRVGEHRRDLASLVEQGHHFFLDRHVEHARRQVGRVGELADDQWFIRIGQPHVAGLITEVDVDDLPTVAQAGAAKRHEFLPNEGSSCGSGEAAAADPIGGASALRPGFRVPGAATRRQ